MSWELRNSVRRGKKFAGRLSPIADWISADVRNPVPMSSFDPARDRYLNIATFSQPAPFTFGNAPPRMPHMRTPAYVNEDISFFKNVSLTESLHRQLRGEFNTLFNRGNVWRYWRPGEFAAADSVRGHP